MSILGKTPAETRRLAMKADKAVLVENIVAIHALLLQSIASCEKAYKFVDGLEGKLQKVGLTITDLRLQIEKLERRA